MMQLFEHNPASLQVVHSNLTYTSVCGISFLMDSVVPQPETKQLKLIEYLEYYCKDFHLLIVIDHPDRYVFVDSHR